MAALHTRSIHREGRSISIIKLILSKHSISPPVTMTSVVPTNSTAPPRVLPALVRFEDTLGHVFVMVFDVDVAESDPSRLENEVLQLVLDWSSYTGRGIDQLAVEACILWDIDQVDFDDTVDFGLAWCETQTVLQPSTVTPPPPRNLDELLPNQPDAVVGADIYAVDCNMHQESWYPGAYGESTGLSYWPHNPNPVAPAAVGSRSPPLATASHTSIPRELEHGRGPLPVAGSSHEQFSMDDFGYIPHGGDGCQSKHVPPPVPYPQNGYQPEAQATGFAPLAGTWRQGSALTTYDQSWRVGTYTSAGCGSGPFSDGSVQ